MKKILFIFVLILTFISCGGGDDYTDPDPDSTIVTYQNTISAIFASNCTSCHGATPTNGAPSSYVTYSQVKNGVQNGNILTRITSTSSPMPPSGPLSSSVITKINEWKASGYLEN